MDILCVSRPHIWTADVESWNTFYFYFFKVFAVLQHQTDAENMTLTKPRDVNQEADKQKPKPYDLQQSSTIWEAWLTISF